MTSTTDHVQETDLQLPGWQALDYPWMAGTSGADKLAHSAVAPLVARARDYIAVTPDSVQEALKAMRKKHAGNSNDRTWMRDVVGNGDVMVMPWCRVDHVLAKRKAKRIGTWADEYQVRPSVPFNGAKYLNFPGRPTVLDTHPSMPEEWIESSPNVVFVEGLLKGDAALSALLSSRFKRGDLECQDMEPVAARHKLLEMLRTIPHSERSLIVSFIGVGNWHHNPEWTSLSLRKRNAVVAFDADCATNPQVWKQANKLMTFLSETKKAEEVTWVNLHTDGVAKAGIDDFFAAGHQWRELEGLQEYDLPPKPAGANYQGETLRVSDAGTSVEAYISDPNGAGGWQEIVPIGGRVLSVVSERTPEDEELITGRLNPERAVLDDPEARVRIEVSWIDEDDGETQTVIVEGSAELLTTEPARWGSLTPAPEIPVALSFHPQWPPRKMGAHWLQAIKGYRRDDVIAKTRWGRMGWVPQPATNPVFVVGNSTCGALGPVPGLEPGVTEADLNGADRFGFIAEKLDEEAWRMQAKEDIEELLRAYIHSGVWTSSDMAWTILALALRPAMPLHTNTSAFFVGPRRKGKSWSAGAVMAFWHPRPGVWAGDALPGSASDTIASTEYAIARTPIWVSDDLAPSVSRQKAESTEDAMANMIRNVHNRAAKRRMDKNMKSREVNMPHALLIVTAENDFSVASASDRTVILRFSDGALGHNIDPVTDMVKSSPIPARCIGHLVRFFSIYAEADWEKAMRQLMAKKTEEARLFVDMFSHAHSGSTLVRHSLMAADLMVGLSVFLGLAKYLGVDSSLLPQSESGEHEARAGVFNQVLQGYQEQRETSPGRAAFEAIQALLSAGRVHIEDLEHADGIPEEGIARFLGWRRRGDTWEPSGPCIGWCITKNGRPCVILDPSNAFNEAKRFHPELIPPGSRQTSSFIAMWDEGYAIPEEEGWSRKARGDRKIDYRIRTNYKNRTYTGIPIFLSDLMSDTEE